MMVKSIQKNILNGYQFGNYEVNISHVQYADDTIVVDKKVGKVVG